MEGGEDKEDGSGLDKSQDENASCFRIDGKWSLKK